MIYLSMLSGFLLCLDLVAVVVDRSQVVVIVGTAMRQGNDVVHLVSLADPSEPGAFLAPTQVLVTLEDAVT